MRRAVLLSLALAMVGIGLLCLIISEADLTSRVGSREPPEYKRARAPRNNTEGAEVTPELIRFQCLDALSGQPVLQARIRFQSPRGGLGPFSMDTQGELRIRADLLPDRTIEIHCSAPAYVPLKQPLVLTSIERAATPVILRLRPAVSLTLTVVDAVTSSPIRSNVTVAIIQGDGQAAAVARNLLTADDGTAQVDLLPAGTRFEARARAPGYEPSSLRGELGAAAQSLTLRLRPGTRVFVRVHGGTVGLPCRLRVSRAGTDATVVLEKALVEVARWPCTLDVGWLSDGSYAIEATQHFAFASRRFVVPEDHRIELTLNGAAAGRILVVDPDDNPMPGLLLRVEIEGENRLGLVRTSKEGVATVALSRLLANSTSARVSAHGNAGVERATTIRELRAGIRIKVAVPAPVKVVFESERDGSKVVVDLHPTGSAGAVLTLEGTVPLTANVMPALYRVRYAFGRDKLNNLGTIRLGPPRGLDRVWLDPPPTNSLVVKADPKRWDRIVVYSVSAGYPRLVLSRRLDADAVMSVPASEELEVWFLKGNRPYGRMGLRASRTARTTVPTTLGELEVDHLHVTVAGVERLQFAMPLRPAIAWSEAVENGQVSIPRCSTGVRVNGTPIELGDHRINGLVDSSTVMMSGPKSAVISLVRQGQPLIGDASILGRSGLGSPVFWLQVRQARVRRWTGPALFFRMQNRVWHFAVLVDPGEATTVRVPQTNPVPLPPQANLTTRFDRFPRIILESVARIPIRRWTGGGWLLGGAADPPTHVAIPRGSTVLVQGRVRGKLVTERYLRNDKGWTRDG